MNKKLLSVIIPIYNSEQVLDRCIESVVTQTYHKLEIILVDDGSTDNSSVIYNKWSLYDSRITVIVSVKNMGQAEARNIGMRHSHGVYLAFVDSDDYLESTAYERMIGTIEKEGSDIAICNFWNCKENTGERIIAYHKMPKKNDCTDILYELFLERLPTAIWCKVIKREIMMPSDKNILWFPAGRRYEETIISFKQILAASKVSVIEQPLYYYVQNSNATTANPKLEDIENIIQNTYEIRQLFDGNYLQESMECYITSTLVFALQLFYRINIKNNRLKKQIMKEISKSASQITLHTAFISSKKRKILPCKLGFIDLAVKIHERK